MAETGNTTESAPLFQLVLSSILRAYRVRERDGCDEETAARFSALAAVSDSAVSLDGFERDLATRITGAFLEEALNTPAADWHAPYRTVNRAAGVIAGYAAGRAAAGEQPVVAAQRLMDMVREVFCPAGQPSLRDVVRDLPLVAQRAERVKLFNGLAERLAKVLIALEA